MVNFFRGTATAMITPFTDTGVNYDALERMIEFQIENGTDALLILGTTGEPATMTEAEKEEVMRFSVQKIAGRAKVIFGSGSNSTAHAVEASIKAEALGADGLLAVTPYYNKCTQNGLVEYYRAIAGAVRIPVICYNVPARTGVNILPATMERIAEIPNIAGIKEACGNMEQICETARRIRGKCDLYSGDDNLNLPILAIGGAGLISVSSNILPKETKQMYLLVEAGRLREANELQDAMLPVIDQLFTEVNPIPAKAAANMLGLDAGLPRGPLTELEPAHKESLRAALRTFGLDV
ncbi:MAG TPA: 4-hydroxy-tetrahydrodipicolinate synthase [Candidatus Borkfalkia faecigallinarum]|uniref:4-hydroxy-tetrahydrodipicolinate synthase n=1 Tax=Candidatus Borkfalkia faecigallinarum TaxID=2838509 RepID=A0A9D2ARA4_9FIRM|nr:4-hydroxy-tetrahydrodipicolinate synthase [Candidatus Borkfalkia faecigallinarum]